MKLLVNNFWPKLICLYALPILCIFRFCLTVIRCYEAMCVCVGGRVNFAKWKADIQMILAIMDRDHSFCEDKPVEPVAEGANDTTLALQKADYKKAKAQ
jgi:hypothetical protein